MTCKNLFLVFKNKSIKNNHAQNQKNLNEQFLRKVAN